MQVQGVMAAAAVESHSSFFRDFYGSVLHQHSPQPRLFALSRPDSCHFSHPFQSLLVPVPSLLLWPQTALSSRPFLFLSFPSHPCFSFHLSILSCLFMGRAVGTQPRAEACAVK